MKKKLLFLLSIAMIMSVISPLGALAEEGIEKYIPEIEEIFDIGDEYEQFDVYRHSHREPDSFSISWMSNEDNISVEIDPNGNILGYSKYSNRDQDEHSRFAKISEEEALENAKDFIAKMDSSLFEKLEYQDTAGIGDLNSYYFIFVRNENDILFKYNSLSVRVNNITGEVESLNMNWDRDIEFPNKEDLIEKEEAYKSYKENQDIELVYMLTTKDKKLEGNFLYTIEDMNKAIDAKTANLVEDLRSMNSYLYYGLYGASKEVDKEDVKVLIDSKEIIDKDQAIKELKEFAGLDASYTFDGTSLMKNEIDGSYTWRIQITKHEKNSSHGTTVSVNAETREVLDFYDLSMNDGEEKEIKYNEEESLEKAKEILKEKMPDKYSQVEYAESMMYQFEENIENYSFSFNRIVDGTRIPQNGFSIGISAVTGEMTNYNYMWNDIELPSKSGLIEKEKARELLLTDENLELNYIVDKDSIKNKKKEIKLVYSLNSEAGIFVDARTGELMESKDLLGFIDMDESEKEYKDIENSYAKDYIEKLKEVGIYLPGEDFNPKEDISQKDFLYLLMNTKGYIRPYDEEYIYEPYSIGEILKSGEKDPENPITRGETMKYLVRSFGQEQSANLGDIYKSDYEDMDSMAAELRGYVAVAEGLGLISGQGKFRADDNLTREEAAVIIYNILNR